MITKREGKSKLKKNTRRQENGKGRGQPPSLTAPTEATASQGRQKTAGFASGYAVPKKTVEGQHRKKGIVETVQAVQREGT